MLVRHVLYCPDHLVDGVIDGIVDIAGGATVTPGSRGYWRDSAGRLIVEPVSIIVFFDETEISLEYAVDALFDAGEQAVAYEVDDVPTIRERED